MKRPSKNFHESFERTSPLKVGSNRQFGYVFAILFFVLSVSTYTIVPKIRIVLVVASILLAAAALIKPSVLQKPNYLWALFGQLLNRVMSPLILAVLFFLVFTPMAFLLKICRQDILGLKMNSFKESYWIKSSNQSTSMKDQF